MTKVTVRHYELAVTPYLTQAQLNRVAEFASELAKGNGGDYFAAHVEWEIGSSEIDVSEDFTTFSVDECICDPDDLKVYPGADGLSHKDRCPLTLGNRRDDEEWP